MKRTRGGRVRKPRLSLISTTEGAGKKLSPQSPGVVEEAKRVSTRSVWELVQPHQAFREFEIVNSAGEWLRTVLIPIDRATQDAVNELWEFLEAEDPAVEDCGLRLVR